MASSTTSMGERSLNVLKLGIQAVEETVSIKDRSDRLERLGSLINDMISIIYGYTCINDSSISTDDEIINWTIPDVANDLASSLWSMASGCYKASASLMRNALDIGFCAVHFQILENESAGHDYNSFFEPWDRGEMDTPDWGITKRVIGNHRSVQQF